MSTLTTKSVIGSTKSTFTIVNHRKSVEKTIVLFLLFLISKDTAAQILNDYPDVVTQEPEVRSDPAGSLIRLKCALNPCPREEFLTRWEFQACGPDLPNKPKCHNNHQNSENNRWTNVYEKNKIAQCNTTYTIRNSTINNSGLYRCVKYSPQFEELTVVKVYQLHIIERIDIKKGIKPKLLDVLPMNLTIIEHSKIVIQCKVYSEFVLPPDIWWLKQIEEPSTPFSYNRVFSISYNNKTYINMKTSQKELGNHTYISKLIIERSNEKDSGIYTCLAVNLFGTSEQDISVDVIANEKDRQGKNSFLILFLIPICFALVPVSVWLSVYFYRKNKLRKISMENNVGSESIHRYEPVLNLHYYNKHLNTRIV